MVGAVGLGVILGKEIEAGGPTSTLCLVVLDNLLPARLSLKVLYNAFDMRLWPSGPPSTSFQGPINAMGTVTFTLCTMQLI